MYAARRKGRKSNEPARSVADPGKRVADRRGQSFDASWRSGGRRVRALCSDIPGPGEPVDVRVGSSAVWSGSPAEICSGGNGGFEFQLSGAGSRGVYFGNNRRRGRSE